MIGELALGTLRNRHEILDLLGNLPVAKTAADSELLAFVENHQLQGSGIGWVDAHLLAASLLSHARLWTRDRRLVRLARRLGVGYAA